MVLSSEQSQALPVHIRSQTQALHSQRPCPEKKIKSFLVVQVSIYAFASAHRPTFTSTQFVAGAITAEVVTLAELAAVSLLGVVPVLAFTCATYTVTAVAANVGSVVFTARSVHIFRGDVIAAAFTLSPHVSILTPEKEEVA